MGENKVQDYITIGRTFENYKWYKPLLTIIVTIIIYLILNTVVTAIFAGIYGDTFITNMSATYEAMNMADATTIYGFLVLILFIPSIYIASKIVKDRPFSSYASSRGGWDWKLYLKCLAIPIAIYVVMTLISVAVQGQAHGVNRLTPLVIVVFIVLICAQSISEEFLFRGIIMQTIGSWVNIPVVAIIIPSVLFAALHPYNIIGVVTTFIVGVMFAVVAWKTNGLEAGSAIHSINNITSFMLGFSGIQQIATNATPVDAVLNLASQMISIIVIIYLGKKYEWFE